MRLGTFILWLAAAPLCEGCALIAGLEERHGEEVAPTGPVVLAELQVVPRPLAVDDTHLYWANEGKDGVDTAIQRVPKAGGSVVTIALPGTQTPQAIEVDVADVYWLDHAKTCLNNGADRLMRAPKDSVAPDGGAGGAGGGGGAGGAGGAETGAGELLWDDCNGRPRDIALDGANAYFTRWGGGRVSQIDKATGDIKDLAETQDRPFGIAVDGKTVYWLNYDDDSDDNDRVVMRDKALGMTADFADTTGNPRWIALDDEGVYWLTETGELFRLSKSEPGGMPQTLATGLDKPGGLALDDVYAYATASGAGTVVKVPKDGSAELVVIASEQDYPAGVAVDETSVYWTNANGGQIMRMRKP